MKTEKLWNYLGILTAFVFLILFTLWATAEKHVNYYYLGSGESHAVELHTDIENAPDESFVLNGMTYEEAVELVKDLNNNLNNNK